uniref:Cyclin L2 n=1 Tax=Piliocolobus tephrosceles TaxID=591936 RepID=A0A8C9H4U7_9PRIM
MAAAAAAGAAGSAAPAAAVAGAPGSGGAPSGSQGVLIGDRLYSGVLITLENCLLPDDKLRFTPSMSSGLDTDTETDLRVVGCELIQAAGILLRLPQVAMATGQVLFQRFFYTKSFVKHSMEHVSMACVHLASKIEEAPRRIRDVINVFHRLRQLREKKFSNALQKGVFISALLTFRLDNLFFPPRRFSVVQGRVWWHDHGSLQPQSRKLKSFSCLSLLSSWATGARYHAS